MSSTPTPEDETDETAPAVSRSLDQRWWWSGALWVVVGVGVIVYQSGPIMNGSTIWLTWVMAGTGALVAVRGLKTLLDDWRVERSGVTPVDPSGVDQS